MSLAYYIVTRKQPDALDTFVNGKALAHLDDGVIEDLLEYEAVLVQLAGRGIAWHPALDF